MQSEGTEQGRVSISGVKATLNGFPARDALQVFSLVHLSSADQINPGAGSNEDGCLVADRSATLNRAAQNIISRRKEKIKDPFNLHACL